MTPRPRIDTTCCECGAPIEAAINRRNNSICEECRQEHVRQYNTAYNATRRTTRKERTKRYYIGDNRLLIPESPTCPVCKCPFDSRLLCACKMTDEQARLDYQRRFFGNGHGRGAYRTQREREG